MSAKENVARQATAAEDANESQTLNTTMKKLQILLDAHNAEITKVRIAAGKAVKDRRAKEDPIDRAKLHDIQEPFKCFLEVRCNIRDFVRELKSFTLAKAKRPKRKAGANSAQNFASIPSVNQASQKVILNREQEKRLREIVTKCDEIEREISGVNGGEASDKFNNFRDWLIKQIRAAKKKAECLDKNHEKGKSTMPSKNLPEIHKSKNITNLSKGK